MKQHKRWIAAGLAGCLLAGLCACRQGPPEPAGSEPEPAAVSSGAPEPAAAFDPVAAYQQAMTALRLQQITAGELDDGDGLDLSAACTVSMDMDTLSMKMPLLMQLQVHRRDEKLAFYSSQSMELLGQKQETSSYFRDGVLYSKQDSFGYQQSAEEADLFSDSEGMESVLEPFFREEFLRGAAVTPGETETAVVFTINSMDNYDEIFAICEELLDTTGMLEGQDGEPAFTPHEMEGRYTLAPDGSLKTFGFRLALVMQLPVGLEEPIDASVDIDMLFTINATGEAVEVPEPDDLDEYMSEEAVRDAMEELAGFLLDRDGNPREDFYERLASMTELYDPVLLNLFVQSLTPAQAA